LTSSRLALVLLLLAARPAAAQLPAIFPAGSEWKDLFYPKLFWIPREGLTVGGYYGITLPTRYDDRTPAPHRLLIALDGQVSTSGSRFIALDAWAPAHWDGWRFRLTLALKHWMREPYFGIGNATTTDSGSVAGTDRYYRVERVRNYARGDVQRRLMGPLRLLVGFHWEHWFLDTLQARSQLSVDLANGTVSAIGIGTDDFSARLGLVFDTRDREAAAQRGVLVEAIHTRADADVLGDVTYSRTTVSARGFLSFGERWGLAGRVAGHSMGGTPPLGSRFMIEESDREYSGFGGPDSHRALFWNRFVDADALFGNFEVRYALIPYFLRTVLVGFVDVGRVFGPGEFTLTTDGLKVGGGGGLFVHFASETAVLGLSTAVGPDGFNLLLHYRWPF
jgi:outer membrane protein assembly factor BamA